MLTHNIPPNAHAIVQPAKALELNWEKAQTQKMQCGNTALSSLISCSTIQRGTRLAPSVTLALCGGAHTRFAVLFNAMVMQGRAGTVRTLKNPQPHPPCDMAAPSGICSGSR